MIEYQYHSDVTPVKISKYPYLGECISITDANNKIIVLFSALDTGTVVLSQGETGWQVGDHRTDFSEIARFNPISGALVLKNKF